MQFLPAAILWALALVKLPQARNVQARHVFWAALFAAMACTLYVPTVYYAVDSVIGGHNLTKLATLIVLMLGFWQFRSALLVAGSTDPRRTRRRHVIGRWAIFGAGVAAVAGFVLSDPGVTSVNLQLAYVDEPGMKVFLLSGSAFLVWACVDLMVVCLGNWRHLRSPTFRVGFLLIGIGCAASCLAITDRLLYGSINQGSRPTTALTSALDSFYWTFEVLAVLCIGVGLILPSLRQPACALRRNLEARALLVKLRPAWQRATAAHREIVLRPSPLEILTPFKPNARMLLHRRFVEIRDGKVLAGPATVMLETDNALLDRAEALLSKL